MHYPYGEARSPAQLPPLRDAHGRDVLLRLMVPIPSLFDAAAIGACSLMAVLISVDRHRRFGAAMVVGVTASIAGGTLRDLLLGAVPVFWIREPWQIYSALGCTAGLFVALRTCQPKPSWLVIPDALSVAIPGAIGARVALDAQQPAGIACVLGLIAGMLGGVLRDIICARNPAILKRELYGSAAVVGAAVVAIARHFALAPGWELMLGTAAAAATRLAALRYHISFGRMFFAEK